MTALALGLPTPEPEAPLASPVQGHPVFFPGGLHGFPEHRDFRLQPLGLGRYCLRESGGQGPDFLAIEPSSFLPTFRVELPASVLQHLGTPTADDLAVLALVTLPRTPGDLPTANLQGLLVINEARGLGRQAVLPDSPWGVRTPIPVG